MVTTKNNIDEDKNDRQNLLGHSRVCVNGALMETNLPLPLIKRSETHDIYDLGNTLLIITNDKISAFGMLFREGIPKKGAILNELSNFWFDYTKDVTDNHLVATEANSAFDNSEQYRYLLKNRSVIVKKTETVPIECVARGYLMGSALDEYNRDRNNPHIAGIRMPTGLVRASRLPEPIFTPALRNEDGRYLNITFEQMISTVGEETAEQCKKKTLELYKKASHHALNKGIIIADTTFEFGISKGKILLTGEILTPDYTSRFISTDIWNPGNPQASYDKQYIYDYLVTSRWDKKLPLPKLPQQVVENTLQRYIDAYERITGKRWLRDTAIPNSG